MSKKVDTLIRDLITKEVKAVPSEHIDAGVWDLTAEDFKLLLDEWPEESCCVLSIRIMDRPVNKINAEKTVFNIEEGLRRERHCSFRERLCEMMKTYVKTHNNNLPEEFCNWVMSREDAEIAEEITGTRPLNNTITGMKVISVEAEETHLVEKETP